MKKIYLLLLTIPFLGCAGDDSDTTQQKIIGYWRAERILIDNVNATTRCNINNEVTFSEDSRYSFRKFEKAETGCQSALYNGAWSKISNNVYSIVLGNQTKKFQVRFPNDDTLEVTYKDGEFDALHVVETYKRQ